MEGGLILLSHTRARSPGFSTTLDFADAQFLWDAPMLAWIDTRRDYGEVREAGLGILKGRVMAVGWVRRGEDHTHIFSLRKANAREKKRYQGGLTAQNARTADGEEAS